MRPLNASGIRYSPPEEAFVAESARRAHGHFNVVHTDTGLSADCDVAGDDPTRHLEDIARIRRAQTSAIDTPHLARWIDRLGVRGAWARALAIDLDRV